MGPIARLTCTIATLVAIAGPASASELDPRLAGVELRELGAPLAEAAEAVVLRTNPAQLASVDAVVLVTDDTEQTDLIEGLSYGVLVVDVIGRPVAVGEQAPASVVVAAEHRARRRVRAREVAPVIVRLELPYATGLETSLAPTFGTAAIVERFSYADLRLAVRVSTGDRVTLLEDARRGFRRVFPSGVGAIDAVRNPSVVASLTPTTDGARLRRSTSYEALGAPVWFKNQPFLTLEAPTGWLTASGVLKRTHFTTRIGFHIFTTTRFLRGYVSQGCVAMREGDLNALADALFFGPKTIPVTIQAAPLPDVYHPFPMEEGLHFVLKNVGTEARPAFTTRGGLYLVEKQLGPPPRAEELADIYLDGEQRLQRDGAVALVRRLGVTSL